MKQTAVKNNSTGRKKTVLNIEIPNDWEVRRFEQICVKLLDGTHFSPKSKEGPFKYITSKNIRNEGLDLANLNHISEAEHTEIYKKCPVKFGDILLTKDGASTGACCKNTLTEEFSLLSSVAVLDTDSILTLNDYLLQFIQSPIGQKTIQDAISGQAITRITLEKIKRFKIPLPPLREQKSIARVLSTWDEAIHKNEQLIAQKELRKKWLMQNLLTGKKRLKEFDGKWEDVELGELLEYEQPTKYLVKDTLYNDTFQTPVLTAGKTFILGYTNEETGIYTNFPVVIFDDFTTASKYVDFPFKAKSSAMKLLRPKTNANLKFVYEAMQVMNYSVGGHERHWISKFVYLTIPCPPLEEQTAIAQVLEAADKEITLLKAKVEKLREEKKGLMQQLLTGKKRLKINGDY